MIIECKFCLYVRMYMSSTWGIVYNNRIKCENKKTHNYYKDKMERKDVTNYKYNIYFYWLRLI